ncbi:ketoacyl-ACP synthase III [Glutamicibacter bergerei]
MPLFARIAAVSYVLPEHELTNEMLSNQYPEWSVEKIGSKTGISTRHVVGDDETASDLAEAAARKLFAEHSIDPQSIDYLIVCTQSPDFLLPSTACIVQEKIGLSTDVGAVDVNLGCSGYIYALGLAKGILETRQASKVLLITTDTYSRYVNEADKSVRTIFGDAATATLLLADADKESIFGINYGTDGSGAQHLVLPNGGLGDVNRINEEAAAEARGLETNGFDLYMNGPEVFNFTLRVVPDTLQKTLSKAGLSIDEVDAFVFHQANKFMLNTLRKKMRLPVEKFVVKMDHCGNTVSSSIPIALREAIDASEVKEGETALLAGFGVGLSWGSLLIRL